MQEEIRMTDEAPSTPRVRWQYQTLRYEIGRENGYRVILKRPC
jgi:hypothetical protein